MTTTFIMTIGIPGSGKSTWTKKMIEKGYHIHSSDALREELLGDESLQEEATMIFKELHRRIRTDLENGISCVYDATNLTRKRRMVFLNEIKKIKCEKKCALFLTPIEKCKENNRKRSRQVRDKVIDEKAQMIELPYWYEGWDDIIPVIDSEECQLDMEATLTFPQDNPYHTLTLGEHMGSAHRFTVEQGYNEAVQTAAAYHDCGKIYTKTFYNKKGELCDIAHFYGHENYGAYVYLTHRCCGKTLTAEKFEKELYIANLINWHMRPLNAWKISEKSYQKDKNILGEQMTEDILNLNKADTQAH